MRRGIYLCCAVVDSLHNRVHGVLVNEKLASVSERRVVC